MSKATFWSIATIPGIKPTEVNLLQTQGIETTQDLLSKTRNQQHQEALARELKIEYRYLRKWIALADLARIPSVGCTYAGLLLHSGIISVSQLSQTPVNRLRQQILRMQVATMQRKDLCPPVELVQQWLIEAKSLI
ncbi:MAG: DUF4332 domain-containing protein [Gloeocapsa sp. DLM2.Bin57]|nr:MAG: DUF4332 domain-containing protein [Gloeocapsa sp. DLM2.Bin57]